MGCHVSIAEAILWGEQLDDGTGLVIEYDWIVSIAEAILWGEQQLLVISSQYGRIVSIAEAILWGEQP